MPSILYGPGPWSVPFSPCQPSRRAPSRRLALTTLPELLLRTGRPRSIIHASDIVLNTPFFYHNRHVFEERVQLSTYFRCLSCNMSTRGVTVYVSDTRYMWEHFCDMSDARVSAEQHIWAAVTAHEKNQTFNCTNGNVFMWKCMKGNMLGLWCWICTVWWEWWVWFCGDDETESESVGWNSGTTWALQHQQIGRDYLF